MAGLLVAAGVAAALARPPHPDVAWPLYLARQLLHGASLTGDFQEMNPPLFVWLSIPAVAFAELTGLTLWAGQVLLFGGLSLASLVLADRVVAAGPLNDMRRVLLPSLGFVFALYPLQEFGNRENAALVLVTPYLLLRGVRAERGAASRPIAVLCGLLGGLGFSYKPYFLPAWVVVELYLMGNQGMRSLRRPEVLSLMSVAAAYAIAVLVVEPGYLELIRTWVGLYGQYLRNRWAFVMFPHWWAWLPITATTAVLALRSTAARPTHYVVLLASLGFWFAAVLQRKGFSYHHLSGGGLGFMVLAMVGAEVQSGLPRLAREVVKWLAPGAALVAVAVSLIVLLGEALGLQPRGHPKLRYAELLTVVKEQARGKPILMLSSNLAEGWPLTLEAEAIWGSRFVSQWQLAALYHQQLWQEGGIVQPRPFEERTGVERVFHEAMIADLERYRPVLILVRRVDSTVRGFGGATRIDYLDYFGSDPRFRRIMERYDERRPVEPYRLFRHRDH